MAKAAIDTAQINLGYTTMTSPIAGRIGPTKFTEGNLVNTSSGTLATVVQLDPIRGVFSIPSASFVRVAELSSKEGLDAVREKFVPQLILPTGETYQHEGKIAFIDNQIDAAHGHFAIYADFPNPEHMLLPGQFIAAVIHRAEQTRLPLVPASAIQRTKDGEQVFVVGTGNRVEMREIKTSDPGRHLLRGHLGPAGRRHRHRHRRAEGQGGHGGEPGQAKRGEVRDPGPGRR